MKTAKIIRHRHKIVHYVNDEIQTNGLFLDDQYKILFSDYVDTRQFKGFVEKYGGKYEWDKKTNKVTEDSKTPDQGPFADGDFCMCDVFSLYITEMSGWEWELHTVSSPTKFEVWTR